MSKTAFWSALVGFSIYAASVVLSGADFLGYSHASQYTASSLQLTHSMGDWLPDAVALPFLDPGFEYVGIAQRVIEIAMGTWIIACAYYVRCSSEKGA